MRLVLLALAAVVVAQPASAHAYSRHHQWAHVSYRHQVHRRFVRLETPATAWQSAQSQAPEWQSADAWRQRGEPARTGVADTVWRGDTYRGDAYRGEASRGDTSYRTGRDTGHGDLDALIARHAQENGVPESLVHRVVIRESRYHPGVVGRGGAMGLMQIKYSTARAMGYTGSAAGLLDADTNLTYAVRYLAGAYRVAGGNPDRAVGNYARGYYEAAKRQGVSPYAQTETSRAWSGSYASAAPIEQVAEAGPVLRSYRYVRHHGRRFY